MSKVTITDIIAGGLGLPYMRPTEQTRVKRKFLICDKIEGEWYFFESWMVKQRKYTGVAHPPDCTPHDVYTWKNESVIAK